MASSLRGQKKRRRESTSASNLVMDGEDTGFLSSCEKALQNDLILWNICGFLPLSDLKKCRLVNRQWKGACQANCVRKCKAIWFNHKSYFGFNNGVHFIEEMPDLIQLINRSGGAFPCKSFVVTCKVIEDVVNPGEETILVNFFRAIAPVAETLWILDLNGEERLFNANPAQNLLFRNLKCLHLSEDYYYSHKNNNLKFCRRIIQNSPQLANLEISFRNSKTASKLITALKTVKGQRINDLYLLGQLNDTVFNIMTGIGLKLRSLSLWFYMEAMLTEDGESLRKFLSSQSNSLEVLSLKHEIEELRITFPVMKELTELRFEICSDSGIGLSRISYAEQFPVLRSLSLVEFPKRDLDSLFDFRIGPVNTVTSLELPEDLDNPALIWQAARIFPKVRKLVVPSLERILMSVYEAWQEIEELTIKRVWDRDSDSASADKVLTTYARSNHGLPHRPLDERDFQPVEFLHKLKVLRLEHGRDLAITDQGCRLLLLKLRSLRCLDLSESSSEKISKEVLQEMRDKFSVICPTKRSYY